MIRILFVCHGNICRSPMAEFIMKDMVTQRGLEDSFYIESAATSTEELGRDLYPPTKRILRDKQIPFSKRRARQIVRGEDKRWDYIFGMDHANIRDLQRWFPDAKEKIHMLLDHRAVSDPWYTDDFETAFNDVYEGCAIWLERILHDQTEYTHT